MQTSKYTDSGDFRCLEDLRGTSSEITLIHMGREACKPYHAFSGVRDEFIIHFVLAGHGIYSTSGNMWPVTQGQMFLIYPNEFITYCADRNEPWTYVWIGFRGSRSESILKQCGFSKKQLVLTAPEPSIILGWFNNLFQHVALSYFDSLYREAVLLNLLATLCARHSQLARAPEDVQGGSDYVDQAIDYISGMYARDITVSDIAEHVGISRSYLNHVFREKLNLSVQGALIDFRLNKAANLLSSTTMSIKEVTHRVGYHDSLVFSKAFKKKFGVSPKQYRTAKEELETRAARP